MTNQKKDQRDRITDSYVTNATSQLTQFEAFSGWPAGLKIRVGDSSQLTPEGVAAMREGVLDIDFLLQERNRSKPITRIKNRVAFRGFNNVARRWIAGPRQRDKKMECDIVVTLSKSKYLATF